MIYNNINIIATAPYDVELCKVAIDKLKANRYELYEVILTFTIDKVTRFFEYTTCLAEHRGEATVLMQAD